MIKKATVTTRLINKEIHRLTKKIDELEAEWNYNPYARLIKVRRIAFKLVNGHKGPEVDLPKRLAPYVLEERKLNKLIKRQEDTKLLDRQYELETERAMLASDLCLLELRLM